MTGLLACLLLSPRIAALPLNEAMEQAWRWSYFGVESGLPPGRVTDLLETKEGEIWVATERGVAWFDGFRWHAVPGLPVIAAGANTRLFPGTAGHVLAGAGHRLFKGNRQGFQQVPLPFEILPISSAGPGELLLGPEAFTHHWSAAGLVEVAFPPAESDVVPVAVGFGRDEPWLQMGRSLHRWVEGRWRRVELGGSGLLPPGRVDGVRLTESGHGFLCVYPEQSTPEHMEARGLWSWGPASSLQRQVSEGKVRAVALALSESGEGIVAFDSRELRIQAAGTWHSLAHRPAAPLDVVFLAFQENGDLWLGTSGGLHLVQLGTSRYEEHTWSARDARSRVNDILVARDGEIWLGTNEGLVILGVDGENRQITEAGGLNLGVITAVAQDGAGKVWIGSGLGWEGSLAWDGETWQHFGPAEGLNAPRVHRIVIDREGRPWFLGLGLRQGDRQPGAHVLADGEFVHWGQETGMLGARVYCFDEASDGSYWFGTDEGLSHFKLGDWQHYHAPTDLRRNKVYTLACDDEGQTWFGHQNASGLGRVRAGGEVVYLRGEGGVEPGGVWTVAPDAAGRVWLGTTVGLVCWTGSSFASFDTGTALGSNSVWPVLVQDNRVLAGAGVMGLAILNLPEGGQEPPRALVEMELTGERGARASWSVNAHWGALPAAEIDTRYRLDSSPWSSWSSRREAYFPEISPGEHGVEVQARGFLDQHSALAGVAHLDIPRPWWRRSPFLVLVGLSVLGLSLLSLLLVQRRRRYAASLRALQVDLAEAQRLESIGRLAGGVAHDFNNLLTAVLGNADLAGRQLPADHPVRPLVEEIESAAHRGAKLTSQLLCFARKGIVRPVAVDVSALVRDLERLLRRLLGENIELTVLLAEPAWAVLIDPGQFEQVLVNLVVNARDAMPTGGCLGITTEHVAGSEQEPEQLAIVVSDTGQGIDEALLPHIFEPFFTTKGVGRGTGLGLATCHGIIRQAGGDILVSSSIGTGTSFRILLPRTELVPVSTVPAEASSALARGSEWVLVVEDEEQVRAVVEEGLVSLGYQVLGAESCPEALLLAREHHGSLSAVVTDVVLPGMTGRELAEILLAEQPDLKVLFMSGHPEDGPLKRGVEQGEVELLSKPFDLAELGRRLRLLLDGT